MTYSYTLLQSLSKKPRITSHRLSQITNSRSPPPTDPNLYTTVVGSRVSLPCNTTPSTGDDQVALLLFYKEDSPPTVQTTSDPSADKDESKNESKEDKFLNHKARPIYSIDAREAPLVLATHFPGDSIDSSRLTIRFEPTQQAANQKQRKKSNRKGNRHHEEGAYASDEGKPSIKPRTSGKGMVYLEISNVKKTDAGVYRCRVDYRRGRTINWMITLSVSGKLDCFSCIFDPSCLCADPNIFTAPIRSEAALLRLLY